MTLCLILLAAGFSSRMRGRDKLLEEVDGVPILRKLSERGLDAGLQLRVTLPNPSDARAQARRDALTGLSVDVVHVDDPSRGMGASVAAGFQDLSADAAMILPGDMPEITTQDLRRVAQARGDIVQATSSDGLPGHPVRFAGRFFPELRALDGDQGARMVLRSHAEHVRKVALPGRHAVTDLDTPEDWAAWRAGQAAR